MSLVFTQWTRNISTLDEPNDSAIFYLITVHQQHEANSFIRNCPFHYVYLLHASLTILPIYMCGMNAFKCIRHMYTRNYWVLDESMLFQYSPFHIIFRLELTAHVPLYNGNMWHIPIHILLEFRELFTPHLLGCLQEFNSPH